MTNFSYTGSYPLEEVVKDLTTDRDEWQSRAERAEAEAAELRAQLDAARATNQWWPWITAPLHTPIVIGYEASIDNTEAPVYGRIIGWLPATPGDDGKEG